MFSPQSKRAVKAKGIIPLIMSSGKKRSISQISAILIINPNKPKVSILKGMVTNFSRGLIKKLMTPKIKPANPSIAKDPVNSTPGINWLASHRPKTPEMICTMRLPSTFSF